MKQRLLTWQFYFWLTALEKHHVTDWSQKYRWLIYGVQEIYIPVLNLRPVMDMGLQPDGTVLCIYSPLPNVSGGLIKLLL